MAADFFVERFDKSIKILSLTIHDSRFISKEHLNHPNGSAWRETFGGLEIRGASLRCRFLAATVKRIWHMLDSQGQILELAIGQTSLKPFLVLPVRSQADLPREANQSYRTESVNQVVLHLSIPAQSLQLILSHH